MFISNIFKRATKEIKVTYENKTGNSGVYDVKGYSCAIIQFSDGTKRHQVCGYIETATDSQVIIPMITDLNKRWVRNNNDCTEKTIIVDVSKLANFFIHFPESYTGDVFILLTQDKFEVDWSGTTRIVTKYLNVVAGTDRYDLGFDSGYEHFRFYAIQIKRRDGNGYVPFSNISVIEYQQIHKDQGVGPAYGDGKIVLSGNSSNNGWLESDWIENYTNAISFNVTIDGTTYDGALLEFNIIGIA